MPSNDEPGPLEQQGIDSLTGFVEDYVTAGLGDLNYAVTDLPQFLADDGPVTTAALFPRTVLRGACRSYARGGGPQNLPGFDAAWGGICEPYLESIGENPTPGSIDRDFEGGQCPVSYRVTTSTEIFPFSDCSTFGPGTSNQGYMGPIRGLRFATENPSGPLCTPGGNVVYLQHGPGNAETLLAGAGYGVKASIVSVVREDGQPDNCGNLPLIYTPPRPKGGLPPLTPQPINIPGIGPVSIGVEFNPSGNIDVTLPEVGVTVEIPSPFGGDDDDGEEEPGGGGPAPGDPGDPGTPVTVPPGGVAEGEAPDGKVLVGVRVQLLNVPETKNQYTSEVYRGVYYVYMGTPGLLDHYPSGAMVTSDQFTFAEQDFLTAWRVRANDKWSIKTTPYYREAE